MAIWCGKMKNEKAADSSKRSKGAPADEKDENLKDEQPQVADDPAEYVRRLSTVLSVLVENPEKKENALRVINTNISQLRKLTTRSNKKNDALIAVKIHEIAINVVKKIDELEQKIKLQETALKDEDQINSALEMTIEERQEFDRLKAMKVDYDLILRKKGELSKQLVDAQEKLERATRELNMLKREMDGDLITKEQYAAEMSVLEAKFQMDISQNYVKRDEVSRMEADLKKLQEDNDQLSQKIKELLNELETTREAAVSDIREWYMLQLKKYRGTFDHLAAEKDSLSGLMKEEVEKRQKLEVQLDEYRQKIDSGLYVPKGKIDADVKRLTDATHEADERRRGADDMQNRLKDDIVKLHMVEKDMQEKDAQIQWLKAKIGDEKISHDSELQEMEAEYNQRFKELEKGLEMKVLKERQSMSEEIERLKRELAFVAQSVRQQVK